MPYASGQRLTASVSPAVPCSAALADVRRHRLARSMRYASALYSEPSFARGGGQAPCHHSARQPIESCNSATCSSDQGAPLQRRWRLLRDECDTHNPTCDCY